MLRSCYQSDNMTEIARKHVTNPTYGVHRSLYSLATVSIPPALATAT